MYLSKKQLAMLIGASISTINRLIKNKTITAIKMRGSVKIFTKQEFFKKLKLNTKIIKEFLYS